MFLQVFVLFGAQNKATLENFEFLHMNQRGVFKTLILAFKTYPGKLEFWNYVVWTYFFIMRSIKQKQ